MLEATTRCRRTRSTPCSCSWHATARPSCGSRAATRTSSAAAARSSPHCQEAGVDVEVVPGITSAISVPAIAGIPLTHRGVATAFTVVTGHDQIRELGGGRDHTVVLLMGVGTLAQLRASRSPAASAAPTARSRSSRTASARASASPSARSPRSPPRPRERGVRSPAVVVVGDVVRLSPYAPAELASRSTSPQLRPARARAAALHPKGPSVTSSPSNLRVAIVGAGPAGIYAGNILSNSVTDAGGAVAIDLFESLPAPYGLIRYGVAPDHPRIKGIVTSLHEMLDAPRSGPRSIRFIGNVEVGRDISLDELQRALRRRDPRDRCDPRRRARHPGHRPARLVRRRRLRRLVRRPPRRADATGRSTPREVAVIGNGNVALDVARVLAKHAVDLRPTEIADNVLAGLEASAVTDVHVFGRRGPPTSSSRPIELRELGEVPDVDIVVARRGLRRRSTPRRRRTTSSRSCCASSTAGATRESDRARPGACTCTSTTRRSRCSATDRVEGVRFERTEPDRRRRSCAAPASCARSPCSRCTAPSATTARRSSTRRSTTQRGVIPNVEGRVTDAATPRRSPGCTRPAGSSAVRSGSSATPSPTRWRRSPTSSPTRGRRCSPRPPVDGDVLDLLDEREVAYTTWDGWLALDAHERELGAHHRAHARARQGRAARRAGRDLARRGARRLS